MPSQQPVSYGEIRCIVGITMKKQDLHGGSADLHTASLSMML